MITIDNFAFCFFSNDIDIVNSQDDNLKSLYQKYNIEKWYRHERNPGNYTSFSQMVNDAIDDTDSEFMIFCNPKTKFAVDDIEFIIDKLSNGYCFVSVVSFGFFGFSKELIRHIGMLDERFINGEYEDDDFAIRLKHFNKAAWWGYNEEKYEHRISKSENLRHITKSIFNQKYEIKHNEILINKTLFSHKKISKRHSKEQQYIYDSWKNSDYNGGNGKISEYLISYKTKVVQYDIKEDLVNFNLKIIGDGEKIKLIIESKKYVKLFFAFVSNLEKNRKFLFSDSIFSENGLIIYQDIHLDDVYEFEIRIFMDNNQIYNNTLNLECNLNLDFKLPKLFKL